MQQLKRILNLSVFVFHWIITFAEDPNYFFTRAQNPFHHQYQTDSNSNGHSDVFPNIHTYIRNPDLETSDLPPHLQRSLPQYQLGLFESPSEPFKYHQPSNQHIPLTYNAQNIPYNNLHSQHISSSTHRPSYAHVFPKSSHNHDPSQTETFLGQITIQSPADLPVEFNKGISSFQPSLNFPQEQLAQIAPPLRKNQIPPPTNKQPKSHIVNQHLDITEKQSDSKGSFLNHRTRIFAPETPKEYHQNPKSPQINNYFVNTNGDVFVPTRTNSKEEGVFTPAAPQQLIFTTTESKMMKDTFNLDSLLEEPIKKVPYSNKDNVEIIQSLTTPLFEDTKMNLSATTEEYSSTLNNDFSEYEYVYDDEGEGEEETPGAKASAENLMVPHQNNSEGGTTESPSDFEPITENVIESSTVEVEEEATTLMEHNTESTESLPKLKKKDSNDTVISEENAVVSVVTTKSVINNTIIGTITPNPTVTEQMSHVTPPTLEGKVKNGSFVEENSTEGWVVVASVQTSRSVSGARYLPSSIVEQHQETKSLAETDDDKIADSTTTVLPEDFLTTTISMATGGDKPNASTESLIDKLDRVQSDLSSGLLSGGFNNGRNNIALITEGVLDKNEEGTTMDFTATASVTVSSSTATSTTSRPPPTQPQVVIRKFSPHARPARITKPPKHQTPRTTTQHDLDVDKPQNDQPIKLFVPNIRHKNGTTGRSSGISNKNQVIVEDVVRESDISERVLNNLLGKITFQDTISAFLPPGYEPPPPPKNTTVDEGNESNVTLGSELLDAPLLEILGNNHSSTSKPIMDPVSSLFKKAKLEDVSGFLPPGFKLGTENQETLPSNASKKIKQDDISSFLPPNYKPPKTVKNTDSLLANAKPVDISALLPPGYKPKEQPSKNVSNAPKMYHSNNSSKTTEKPKAIGDLFEKAKEDDISAFLPPGYKSRFSPTNAPNRPKPHNSNNPNKTTEKSKASGDLFESAKQDDISAFLPPGFKSRFSPTSASNSPKLHHSNNANNKTTDKPKGIGDLLENAKVDDIAAFLPPGYKSRFGATKTTTTPTTIATTTTEKAVSTTTPGSGGFKVVFPSRPGVGGSARKNQRLTTPRAVFNEPSSSSNNNNNNNNNNGVLAPAIQKGWPTRATTPFTGWPTPSTTPISIEKLLEAARAKAEASTTTSSTTTTTTTTRTTTTTTTAKPTTPGWCETDCDLAGTIKLIGGAKWVPELLDRNTKEWQILANEVQYQLEDVYSKSSALNSWYKKVRIDGFSEGSVLVDYLVELNNISRDVNTRELKSLFHEALENALIKQDTDSDNSVMEGKLSLGNFILDPNYTDFVVLPKQISPTVGYAEDNVFLPQWAIAIIVIGLASLLFVIIFGVTVLVNKQKNAKKKQPSVLTEAMLNELNKNHMGGGIDNYGADDLYNMEDVWNDRPYETKLPKKRPGSSIHDGSMPNIYDSWRSEWNGYYYNTYYGNHPGSSQGGYSRRRSDYDTNF